ncbi:cell envelope integrity protein TolA [Bdellovibrio svalbardensis]|uniref:TonB family protein n=1 Tax=Bdellovibrio svalbardensis TaxID=2972972 RepID=A0ABT6DJS0_9BACT|nr:cell envelope integrity protein TolA [Bdellovibrio svalbardensis]MDG0817120.1 TonB family protein [Bdellovibrio svalbardensis]
MKKSPSFKKYVSLSLIVHVLVLGGLFLFGESELLKPKEQSVSIDLLTPEDLAKMAALEKLQEKRQAERPMNQIVEQNENSVNEKEPVDARFLSAKNQQVTKQTVAVDKGEFQNLKKAAKPRSGPKGDGKVKAEAKEDVKSREEKVAKDLFKSFDPSAALERQKQRDQAANEAGQGLGRGDGSEVAKDGSDASKTNDYIKDVENGLETMLNTREFKYYSYYNRIRRQLSQHWESRVREKLTKMFKEGRSPASTAGQDRVTKLMIVLNDKGTLVRVQVLMDSGVHDLDDAAVEAFRAAAPFPNPPKGIIEGDGTVKIRWDFVLES